MARVELRPLATRADLRNPELRVADVMRTDFRSCNATTGIAEIATALVQSQSTFLAVTRVQVPFGVVTERSLASALSERGGDLSKLTAADLMEHDPPTIPMETSLEAAVDRLAASGGRLLAVDRDGLLKGVVTPTELGPQLSAAALGRLVARVSAAVGATDGSDLGGPHALPGTTVAPAEAARAADPTADILSSKSQAQPHPWDSPTGEHPQPVPLVSQSDLVNPMLTVAEVAHGARRTCSPHSTALEAVLIFRDDDCGVLPVTDEGRPIGVVTDRDVALALADHEGTLGTTPVDAIMSRDVVTIEAGKTLDVAVDLLDRHGLRRLPVVDQKGLLTGILSWADLVPHLSERGLGRIMGQIAARG